MAVIERYSYDPYGKVSNTSDTISTGFLFNAKDGVMTDDTGLYYMRSRYYSPDLMRFINADVFVGDIRHSPTLNRYTYANANPTMYVDPDGEYVTVLAGGAIGGLIGGSANLIDQVMTEGWDNVSWKEVAVNTATGAASGAIAGTGIGLVGAISANSALNMANYTGTQYVNNESVEWDELAFSGGVGAIAGGIGGAGVLDQDTVRFFGTWYARSEVAKAANLPLIQAYSIVTMKAEAIRLVRNNSFRATLGTILNTIVQNVYQKDEKDSTDKSYLETSSDK
ncbi:RHS repeat-associated core domain-containing protein [Marinilactibacillus psychrotolerans]|uniref:RHS repeat-associated core domain-containing protein n=1 Tax=Marinilactibacillus psychrotolerans TaxID=191770 RepID=UPI001867AAF8|nr:RHS repeat-associated core domain-containing protein [Marinilactibacillus psychrotolerans]